MFSIKQHLLRTLENFENSICKIELIKEVVKILEKLVLRIAYSNQVKL